MLTFQLIPDQSVLNGFARKKMNVDRTINKFNARFVAKGFIQKQGINYFDTYSLTTRLDTIRVLIALARIHDLVIHQMDVKMIFLNGELNEEVCIQQPMVLLYLVKNTRCVNLLTPCMD